MADFDLVFWRLAVLEIVTLSPWTNGQGAH